MKKLIISGLTVLAVGLYAPQITQAQGTTYMSNLEQPPSGSIAVGSDQWVAKLFLTGNNNSGYFLDSFQLGIQTASGVPADFTVMVYTEVGLAGILPGNSLGSLTGTPSPTTAGTYTYTAPQKLLLNPNTGYFIVVTGGTGIASGAYEWSVAATSSYNSTGGWGVLQNGGVFRSSDGSSWNAVAYTYPQFAVNATPFVPEPGVSALIALGGLCFLWHRRKP
jgi:hypothetical protein